MTEAEWLACANPQKMLNYLGERVSDRKVRLFVVACCRRNWDWMTDETLRRAVETAEAFADGKASQKKRGAAYSAARRRAAQLGGCVPFATSLCAVRGLRFWVHTAWYQSIPGSYDLRGVTKVRPPARDRKEETARLADLLRDLVGNPFRHVLLRPSWLRWQGGVVPNLAAGIYEERAFDRLPILADALEEAGCTNSDILGHCRGPGEHVRGCWAVDLILGKG
jgi:hypothetical protein